MKLAVILGSTRQGRVTDRMARWVVKTAEALPDTEVELLDLRDFAMPFFDEARSPKFNPDRQPHPEVKKWLDKLDAKDAYIIVTPEYNHSIPAVLKNALDYTDWQVAKKPFAVVSHGSSGGARATSDIKVITSEIRAFTISTNVAFTHQVGLHFDEDGNLNEDTKKQDFNPEHKLHDLLEELKWYSDALANARSAQ